MAVWLTMNMSHAGSGNSANTARIYVTVDVHWDAKHYNRDGGSLKVAIDGTTFSYTVPFNANETSSGSERLYTGYYDVPHTSSRTVYGSATFQATNATTATPASAQVYLSGSGGSGGGSSGGDSGGSSGGGDSGGDDDDDGGGNSGSGSGGGNSGPYYEQDFWFYFYIGAHCYLLISENGERLGYLQGNQQFAVQTNDPRTYTLELIPCEGYKISEFTVNTGKNVSYADTGIATITPYNMTQVYASVELDVSEPDGDGPGWTLGDSYDANDPPHYEGKSDDGSGYVLVRQAEGTELFVYRTSVYDSSYYEQGDYIGELVDGELFQDEYGTWYKYKAWANDYFYIEAAALPGYKIDTHTIQDFYDTNYTGNECTNPFYVSGMTKGLGSWRFDGSVFSKVARIYTTATKIVDSGKDYGSGSGTLYFDFGEYAKEEFAVEFIYSDNKFYVTGVKKKNPFPGNSYWWTFDNLLVKINDSVIYYGEKEILNSTSDPEWFDLNITGCTSITDEVKITLSGTVTLKDYGYADISPTVKTILINSTDSGGGSGDDSDGDDSGAATVVGQVNLWSSTNNPSYSTEFYGVPGIDAITIIKFTTPSSVVGATSMFVGLGGVNHYNKNPFVYYALCTSDVNNGLYIGAPSYVYDPYMLEAGMLRAETLQQGFYIDVDDPFKPGKDYYLVFWLSPSDPDNSSIMFDPSGNHEIILSKSGDDDDDDDDDPVEKEPIATTVIGQVNIMTATSDPPYRTDLSGAVLYNTSAKVISIIKFTTPDIDEGSTALGVQLSNVSASNPIPSLRVVLCTSDVNNGLYIGASTVVDDPYQISSKWLTVNEYSQEFFLKTDQLESNKTYYLMLWIPSGGTDNSRIDFGKSVNHTIQVYYGAVEDPGDEEDPGDDSNTVNIMVASGFESFTIFINTNGTGFEEYVAYIGNGVTFEPYH